MPPRPANERLIPGCATEAGTNRFRQRFAKSREPDFYRLLRDTLHVSSVGLGTYLGECDEATDRSYIGAIRAALANGINLIDSAINYRCQRSERAVRSALATAIADEVVRRDEVIVCTKGGYVPLEGAPPATRRDYDAFLKKEYLDRGILAPGDLVAGGHCLAPSFLDDQLRRSRRNLGVATIDVYYLHNPEQQLDVVSREEFRARMRAAFETLERATDENLIGVYGCATWSGLRAEPGSRGHLDLAELVGIAREVAGDDHHFRMVQLPVNLAMTEAVRTPTQRIGGGSGLPLLQAAAELGMSVIASAPLMQGQLARGLPAKVRDAFPGLQTDAQCAVAFVRQLPVVTAALVGMKTVAHVEEQLAGATVH